MKTTDATKTSTVATTDANASCSEDPSIIWSELGFAFRQTKHMYLARTTPSRAAADAPIEWARGEVVEFRNLELSPASAVLNYGQAGFEGLKACRSPEGQILLFRPEENARRFRRTAARLAMPPYPSDWFVDAVTSLVRKAAAYVPPFHLPQWPKECPPGSRSLYIRPVMIGNGPVLGVQPAREYIFYIYVSPVGVYRSKGALLVLDSTHRAPAYGIGDIKAAANYPTTLQPYMLATQSKDFVDVLYLDARHDTYIEEVGSSNFFAVLKDGSLVTPRLGSILPGITRDSVITIARELFGWKVVERDLSLTEVFDDADEVFFTGTAALIVPVTNIRFKGHDHLFRAGRTDDTKAALLKAKLLAIQTQQQPDPFGWVKAVDPAAEM